MIVAKSWSRISSPIVDQILTKRIGHRSNWLYRQTMATSSGQQTPGQRLREPYLVTGQVVHGFGRGSKELGIPTANIDHEVVQTIGTQLDSGIYYGFCQLLAKPSPTEQLVSNDGTNGWVDKDLGGDRPTPPTGQVYPMVCSLGWNPQYMNEIRSLEVHVLNRFSADFYGYTLRAAICGYIRAETKFESLDQLIDCIHNDIKVTEQELNDRKEWSHVIDSKFFADN